MAASNVVWKVVALGSGLAAAKVSNKAVEAGWRRATGGGEPPRNPSRAETPWRQALVWSAASGLALGVSRMLAQQGMAKAWKTTTGALPAAVRDASA